MEDTSYFITDDPNELYVNGQYFYQKDEGDSSTSCTSSSSTVSNNGTPTRNCKGNYYVENSNEIRAGQQQNSTIKQVTNPFLEAPLNSGYKISYLINNRQLENNDNVAGVTTDNNISDHNVNSAVSSKNSFGNYPDYEAEIVNANSNMSKNISSYFTNSTNSMDTKNNSNIFNTTQSSASHTLPSSSSMNPFLMESDIKQPQQKISQYSSSSSSSSNNNNVNDSFPLSAPTDFNKKNTTGLSQLNESMLKINNGSTVPLAQSQFSQFNQNVVTNLSPISQHHNKPPEDNSNLYSQRPVYTTSIARKSVSHPSSSESTLSQFKADNINLVSSALVNNSFQLPNNVSNSYSGVQLTSHSQLSNQIPTRSLNPSSSDKIQYHSNLPSRSSVPNVTTNTYVNDNSNINLMKIYPDTVQSKMYTNVPSQQSSSNVVPQTSQSSLPISQPITNQRNIFNYNTSQNKSQLQAQDYNNSVHYTQQQQQHSANAPPSSMNLNYQIPSGQIINNYQPPTSKSIDNYQTRPNISAAIPYQNNASAPNQLHVTQSINVQNHPAAGQQIGHPLIQQQQQLRPYSNYGYSQSRQTPYDGSNAHSLSKNLSGMSITQGYNKLKGMECMDLLRCRDILPKERVVPPPVYLSAECFQDCKCNPDILRCTLNKVPETRSLLDKSRLPFGILLHPFRDLQQLSVINCTNIVRCRSCRTYINPFVFFIDSRHWKCNLCFRTNEVPDDFLYNPLSKMYDEPTKRPEIRSATIEYIAPSEYMLRPPQPAVYLFVLDVSRIATQTGYLRVVCEMIIEHLDNLPGDARTSIGFMTFDSVVHYYSLSQGLTRPQQLVISDIDEMFLPLPDDLIVNLNENKEMVVNLLTELPRKYKESYVTNSALGAALQAAYKLMAPTGGRVSVFQTCLPNYGPGALKNREDPSQRTTDQMTSLKPASDFYKKLGLECNGQHVAIDLFILNSQYIDLVTIAGICQVSGGCMYHFPLFNSNNIIDVERFEKSFRRYLSRKIGFEAVMRLRCTRGLSIHSFHGNFFVRTTDLLALPNINPDSGFGMQVSIDENLSDLQNIALQAALLYTSSKGERRIRVHTLCLPVSADLQEILTSADQQCIAGLLSKMAVDRIQQTSLSDAREAFLNAAYDPLNVYKMLVSPGSISSLLAPNNMQLLPLYILALLKNTAFRTGSVRLDDRMFAMYQMKCLPLDQLMRLIYPELYEIHNIVNCPKFESSSSIPNISIMQLSAERVQSNGIYLLDDGEIILILIGQAISPQKCSNFFGVPQCGLIPENEELPTVDTEENRLLHAFINYLQSLKPHSIPIQMIKYSSPSRVKFFEKLIEDKTEFGVSYYEFLQTIRSRMN